jgi:Flp pilus assembly protein TadG
MRLLDRRTEGGLALVEFALVLPLLLVLALGAVDLGRGLISLMELEQAAQEGALYGSFAPTDPNAIETRVRTSATGIVPLADTAAVDVQVTCPTGKVGVEVGYTLPLITPLLGPLLGDDFALRAQSIGTNFTDAACSPTP